MFFLQLLGVEGAGDFFLLPKFEFALFVQELAELVLRHHSHITGRHVTTRLGTAIQVLVTADWLGPIAGNSGAQVRAGVLATLAAGLDFVLTAKFGRCDRLLLFAYLGRRL